MNWRAKILAKIILSRLPVSYTSWYSLGMFRHGRMNNIDYAMSVSQKHIQKLLSRNAFEGATCMEMGPGDSIAGALVACSYGASSVYMVDVGSFARKDIDIYNSVARFLNKNNSPVHIRDDFSHFDEMLNHLNIKYITEEDPEFSVICDQSVDFIWSNAVLEHVRKKDVGLLIENLYRILKKNGNMSHRIDYKDHLGGSINNMRFSDAVWEGDFFSSSGFYTNRLRHSEFMTHFLDHNFAIEDLSVDQWENIPLPRKKISSQFDYLSDDDLKISGADIILLKE